MPGARWFPDGELSYAERALRGPGDRVAAVLSLSQTRDQVRPHARRAARPGRPGAGRAAAPRRRARRPRRGLPAEHRRDARGVPRHRQPRRHLGVVRARVRHGQRGRPLRADRRPRSCSPSTGTDTARRPSTAAPRSPSSRPRSPAWPPPSCSRTSTPTPGSTARSRGPSSSPSRGRSRSSRCPSTTRCTSCTPRARPGCPSRSCTATAGSSSSTPRRSRLQKDIGAGRPLLLVLHHRVDDVELPGVRAARGGHRRGLRRRPGVARTSAALWAHGRRARGSPASAPARRS